MAKLVRIAKPGGGFALGKVNGKLITDVGGAPCCCNPGDWREAISCANAEDSIYIPSASTCTGDGTSVAGKVIVYGPGCWGVSNTTTRTEDLPPDAVLVEDTSYECVQDCYDPACGGELQCCQHVWSGVRCNTVNGVDYSQASLVNVGSTPVLGYQYDADITIDLTNFGQIIGSRLYLRIVGSLMARYQKSDPFSTVCQSDTLIESVSALSGQVIDTGRNINDFTEYRVVQDIEDVATFSRQPFVGAVIPTESAVAGKVLDATLGINWSGSIAGGTIRADGGLYPVLSPCNARTLTLDSLLANPGGGAASSPTSSGFFEVTYRSGPSNPFTVIGASFVVGRQNSFVPTRTATANVEYLRSPLTANMNLKVDSEVQSPLAGGGGFETHLVQIDIRQRGWVEFNGPCNPNLGRPAPPLPPGINPETMQPYTQPGKCYGCGQ